MSDHQVEFAAAPFVPPDLERWLIAPRSTTVHWVLVTHTHQWRPPTDMFETAESFVVQVEIAGMRGADFSVSIQDRRVTISGARQGDGEARAYHQMEIHFGEFRTDIELPGPFDREAVEASYNDGYLRIVLPKPKPRRISIE